MSEIPSDLVSFEQAMEIALRFHQEGRLEEAEDIYLKILRLEPEYADALHYLAVIRHQRGEHLAALDLVGQAVKIRPDNSIYFNSEGQMLRSLDRLQEAAECYVRALALTPAFPEAHNNLGNVRRAQGEYRDAIACYQRALALNADYAEAHNNLGGVFNVLRRFDEAANCFQKALSLNPRFAEAHANLGGVFNLVGKLDDAELCFRNAIACREGFSEAHNQLAGVSMSRGQMRDAISHFRTAVSLDSTSSRAYSNLLMALNFAPALGVEEVFLEHLDYAKKFELRPSEGRHIHSNARDPAKCLTVGYVSPDFRDHVVARILISILQNHARERIRIVAYSNYPVEDDFTSFLKAHVCNWRNISGMSDPAVSQLIRDDEVDILVDLAGHSGGNRLPVFARKPAPVQVTWLGYPNTTGLASMDYRLTDRRAEPAGHERYYSEKLVYLPDSVWCYPDQEDVVTIGPLPAGSRGCVTFGSFNNFAKIGPEVLELWALLLKAVRGSRLLLISAPQGKAREQLLERFASQGIGAGRIDLVGSLPRARYLEMYNEVDMALDPFPYNGGATTCDALWMGVPVITLAGDRFVSRAGVSLLGAAGLGDWVAASEAEYVELGRSWAGRLEELAQLRAGLRERMRASPLMDAKRFTRNLEAAYRSMWERYCAGAR